ncbi:MAG: asparagine synthase B [Acidobacteriota bacterium]
MCSILGFFELSDDDTQLRSLALSLTRRMRHRGPDWSGVYQDDGALLAHERLAIVDPVGGAQPLRSADGRLVLAVNGEIYNHRELRQRLAGYDYQTGSDCEVILALYAERGPEAAAQWLEELNGIFAFVLWDVEQGRYLVARDPIGVIPLYWGRDRLGQRVVASEMKALFDVCPSYELFPPGHVYDSALGQTAAGDPAEDRPRRYYRPAWREREAAREEADPSHLRAALDAAVKRQLMSDVPYGVLLSGGLDSSIIAALAERHRRLRIEADDREEAWWPRLHTFSTGLEGSPDLAAARRVAEHLGSAHHELTYTVQEGIDALYDVIRHIETYDVTTIRASTPMFLMARRIRAMGIKMVLSGEGADEVFGGYLYFHKAPNADEFHAETVRKLFDLHYYDCLRANKSMAAWGVEARVPFLDRGFLEVAMALDARHKMTVDDNGTPRMEKHILRQAFEDLLPDDVVWRQKEQFSDGVGYSWIDSLRALADEEISERQVEHAVHRFPINPPQSKEAFFYREIFERLFPGDSAASTVPGGKSIACSSAAAIAWDASFADAADPSGRAVAGVHREAW